MKIELGKLADNDNDDGDEANRGVANGPSKTMGLARFLPNFTGLAVSFFERLWASRSLDFFQG